nr:protein ENHANCED DISEASE RESISTANCE 2 isoform X5 [Arachis hypogaea]
MASTSSATTTDGDAAAAGGRMEGWLYLIRSNRIGLQFSRKRYFVLDGNNLRSFKSSANQFLYWQDPVRSAIVDSCIRVMDNGRESINRKVFFMFTLYNSSNHNDRLKLGASRPEEAARWIQSIHEASLKGAPDTGDEAIGCSKRRWQSFRLSGSSSRCHPNSVDWTASSFDVIAPSPWTIFGCQNGLRLFKEAKDRDSVAKKWDDHPAIMAVGVVDGTSEAVFQTLMSLGPSRSEWDFCFYKGSVVEHLDGHTDIIHKQLYSDWLPWGMKRRDLLLRRYWRREDDGTYVILYHSVFHKKCPPQNGYVRACLKTLRELLKAKLGNCPPSDYSSGELIRKSGLRLNGGEISSDTEIQAGDEDANDNFDEEVDQTQEERASLVSMNDADDKFYDVLEPSDCDEPENEWMAECSHQKTQKLSTAASFVRRLHDLAVQKRGYVDLHEMAREESISCAYGSTLPKDPTCTLPCSLTETDPSTFLIRGENYLVDGKKVKAKGTLMQLVAADWLRSDRREDDLAGRPGSIVQKYAAQGGPEFFFIINIQVPGSTTYSLALYYMMNTPVEDAPLLESFIKGDDAFRNSRFKLIPYISKGSWIVKQSVGKKACLVGQALEIHYFQGKNYLELGIDIGSSTVARGVVSLVLGYLSHLVIEMAFLVQNNAVGWLSDQFLICLCANRCDMHPVSGKYSGRAP